MVRHLSLCTPTADLVDRFNATPHAPFEPSYNITPGEELAVISNESPATIDRMTWGFVSARSESEVFDADDPITEVEGETLLDGLSTSDAYEKRRCLVLADGFYEWKGDAREERTSQPYRVALEGDDPFAMAGLWQRGDDESSERVAIITTEASERVESCVDRMPVILDPDEETIWLHYSHHYELDMLLDPYTGGDLRSYPVSRTVLDPDNDGPELINEIDPLDIDDE